MNYEDLETYDILEKKYPTTEIRKTREILQFKNTTIELVGTGALKSQLYPADYDFIVKNIGINTQESIYKEFKRILDDINNYHLLTFIEFKIHRINNSKYKINKIEDFDEKTFLRQSYNVLFYKIDLIINIDNKNIFKEVSCIYMVKNARSEEQKLKDTTNIYEASLRNDMKELYDEGKYYKALKRYLMICKIHNDIKPIEIITDLFNSNYGKLYMIKSELEASNILLEHIKKYDNSNYDMVKKRVELYLKNKNINIKIKDIKKLIDDYEDILNKKALIVFESELQLEL
jgi:hypothetical protein